MTNYFPTRADQLQPGDVVRDPYTGKDMVIAEVVESCDRGRLSHYQLWADEPTYDTLICSLNLTDTIDKRITDEEYEALSAPGVKDECIGN